MPSDPSGVKPLATLVRLAPDWFDDQAGIGGHFVSTGSGVHWFFHQFCLFNNATQGQALKVYGISLTAQGGGGMVASFAQQAPGTFIRNCSAIRPDMGAPFGQIYFSEDDVPPSGNPTVVNPFYPENPVGMVGVGGDDSASYFSPFPMYIIPANWALCLTNFETTDDAGAFFWYQVANE